MYDIFIEVSVTGNVSLVGGRMIWKEIQSEYSELIKTPKARTLFEAWRKLENAETRFKFVNRAVEFLYDWYDEDIAMALVENGFDYVIYDQSEPTAYLQQLEFVKAEARTMVIIIDQYRRDYERLLRTDTTITIRSELDFEEELQVLSHEQGYRIDKKTTTVFEVCAIINTLIRRQEQYKKK